MSPARPGGDPAWARRCSLRAPNVVSASSSSARGSGLGAGAAVSELAVVARKPLRPASFGAVSGRAATSAGALGSSSVGGSGVFSMDGGVAGGCPSAVTSVSGSGVAGALLRIDAKPRRGFAALGFAGGAFAALAFGALRFAGGFAAFEPAFGFFADGAGAFDTGAGVSACAAGVSGEDAAEVAARRRLENVSGEGLSAAGGALSWGGWTSASAAFSGVGAVGLSSVAMGLSCGASAVSGWALGAGGAPGSGFGAVSAVSEALAFASLSGCPEAGVSDDAGSGSAACGVGSGCASAASSASSDAKAAAVTLPTISIAGMSGRVVASGRVLRACAVAPNQGACPNRSG